MLVTEAGISTELMRLQPWKARKPIVVTEFGMTTEVILQPLKAPSPISVTK